jgi:hypothetical protein
MKVTMAISMLRAIGYSGVTGSQSSIFSFTNAGFEMSALQGNTFDREYTAEVSADD